MQNEKKLRRRESSVVAMELKRRGEPHVEKHGRLIWKYGER